MAAILSELEVPSDVIDFSPTLPVSRSVPSVPVLFLILEAARLVLPASLQPLPDCVLSSGCSPLLFPRLTPSLSGRVTPSSALDGTSEDSSDLLLKTSTHPLPLSTQFSV